MSIQLSYSFSFKKNQNQYNGTDYIYKKLKTGKEMGGGGGGGMYSAHKLIIGHESGHVNSCATDQTQSCHF